MCAYIVLITITVKDFSPLWRAPSVSLSAGLVEKKRDVCSTICVCAYRRISSLRTPPVAPLAYVWKLASELDHRCFLCIIHIVPIAIIMCLCVSFSATNYIDRITNNRRPLFFQTGVVQLVRDIDASCIVL